MHRRYNVLEATCNVMWTIMEILGVCTTHGLSVVAKNGHAHIQLLAREDHIWLPTTSQLLTRISFTWQFHLKASTDACLEILCYSI